MIRQGLCENCNRFFKEVTFRRIDKKFEKICIKCIGEMSE